MKIAILLLALAAAPDAGHAHCWHYANFLHAVPNHSDEVCCHCGEGRCRSTYVAPAPGHGRFDPQAPVQFFYTSPDGGFLVNQ